MSKVTELAGAEKTKKELRLVPRRSGPLAWSALVGLSLVGPDSDPQIDNPDPRK